MTQYREEGNRKVSRNPIFFVGDFIFYCDGEMMIVDRRSYALVTSDVIP